MRRRDAAVSRGAVTARALLVALALGVALGGCGGHGGARSVLPGSSGTTGGGSAVPKSTNVALFDGTLWYGAGASLYGSPLQPGGTGAELDGDLDGIVDPVPVAMTIAPDGTLYDLISDGEMSWKLQAYAPGAFGAQRPEETIAGSGYPHQVVLVGDGIDVLATTGFNTSQAASTLRTYAYGAGNGPQPIRTLNLGTNVSDVASDNLDRIYVARHGGAGISVYPPAATCNCNPVRTIATGSRSNDAIAASSDGIVYVLSKDPGSGAVTIDAYTQANNGPTPSWTIGPIPASRGTPAGGITVDSDGKLYVSFKDARNASSVDVYGLYGAGGVQRTIPAPVHGGYVTAIAIGPLMQTPPSGVLYVGNGAIVNAFALSASGAASPQRTLTALLGPDYPGGPTYQTAFATAATTDGRLYVARGGGATPSVGTCSIAAESPSANGSSGLLFTLPCVGNGNVALAPGPNGALETATVSYARGAAPGTEVVRDATSGGGFAVPFAFDRFATDPQGDVYLSDSGAVYEYPPNASTGSAPLRTIPLTGVVPEALAAAPDGWLYLSARFSNSPVSSVIYSVNPGQTGVDWNIGAIPGDAAALATDAASDLYVGFNLVPSGTKVNVYSRGSNGDLILVRTITDPVPVGTNITSLSIFQQ
jgi:hypothetical protein